MLLAVFVARALLSARSELAQGHAAVQRKQLEEAVVHYRRAARWYVPFSPLHVAALARLSELGSAAEAAGDSELALSAYRAVRGAIMSTRSFYTPEPHRLSEANRRIAALMAAMPAPPIDAGKTETQLYDEHLKLLTEKPGPRLLWTFVLLAGFVGWIGGAFVFVERAMDDDDRLIAAQARRWGAVIVVSFALFVLGMAFA